MKVEVDGKEYVPRKEKKNRKLFYKDIILKGGSESSSKSWQDAEKVQLLDGIVVNKSDKELKVGVAVVSNDHISVYWEKR